MAILHALEEPDLNDLRQQIGNQATIDQIMSDFQKEGFQSAKDDIEGKGSPLTTFILARNYPAIVYCLENEAPVTVDCLKRDPLNCAMEIDSILVLDMLLERGAKFPSNDTVVRTICSKKAANILRAYISRGFSSELTGSNGEEIIMDAVRNKYAEILSVIFENGEISAEFEHNGETPMQLALKLLDFPTIAALISSGASLGNDYKTIENTCLYRFLEVFHRNFETALGEFDEENSTKLLKKAIKVKAPHLVEFLITHNASVDCTLGKKSRTPLHKAAKADSQEIVSILLANGADVNAIDREGKTPIQLAQKDSECYKILASLR